MIQNLSPEKTTTSLSSYMTVSAAKTGMSFGYRFFAESFAYHALPIACRN
jgi:hypothetical protein